MHKQQGREIIRRLRIALLLILGLALTSCNGGGGEAQAQGSWRIVTFEIVDDSFVLRSATTLPTIEVANGTTIYSINAGGAVLEFTPTGPGGGFIPASPLDLDQGDQVIERATDRLVTVIRLI